MSANDERMDFSYWLSAKSTSTVTMWLKKKTYHARNDMYYVEGPKGPYAATTNGTLVI